MPGFKLNSEKASEIAPDRVVSESPQHQQPNSQIARNTCFELIIHPNYKSCHLSATHSNISFAIALRNLANKQSSILETTHIETQLSHELSLEPSYTITSDSDDEDEHIFEAKTVLDSSLPFVLESIHDLPYDAPNHSTAIETLSTDEPCSSTQITPQPLTTNVSPPPTLLLDSVILKEVCENIPCGGNKSYHSHRKL